MIGVAKPPPDHPIEPVVVAKEVCPGSPFWLAGASRIGARHTAVPGGVREDALALETHSVAGRAVFVAAVADGVGSAALAWLGSTEAANGFVEGARRALEAGAEGTREVAQAGVEAALGAVVQAAEARDRSARELASTLLGLVAIEEPEGPLEATVFKVGDGLVAAFGRDGVPHMLLSDRDSDVDGAIRTLVSARLRDDWDGRFHTTQWQPNTATIALLTDGMSDDLIPLRRNGPRLVTALATLEPPETADRRIQSLIEYERPGSGDDRTFVFLLRRAAAVAGAVPAADPTGGPTVAPESDGGET